MEGENCYHIGQKDQIEVTIRLISSISRNEFIIFLMAKFPLMRYSIQAKAKGSENIFIDKIKFNVDNCYNSAASLSARHYQKMFVLRLLAPLTDDIFVDTLLYV